ncbi:enoyl-CoA hydratase/isomerase family protein [Risungbinella massiliensis]|uniref:enoyl-CoA hydratase/isomerase family protein n=1 Tax=Risungbinella massiliensis TaxID=1329796 RepID=UPI0005CC1B73|nr:enoyl-CoA hydratase-related protein [Risungbinella massiliensis]
MYETILYEQIGQVGKITLNRPEKFNAFTEQMHQELVQIFRQVGRDENVRAVILTGAGRGFNAGQDLKEFQTANIPFRQALEERYHRVLFALEQIEKPVVAAVNGIAAGAGMSLACACDLRVVSEKASFANNFIHIGLIPDSGGNYYLPRLVGYGKAMELAMTGEKVSAEEALRIGLANRLFPHVRFEEESLVFTQHLANLPTKSMGLLKRAMKKSFHQTLPQALEYEAFLQELAGGTEDFQEGVLAFLEKRPPVFKGK